MQTEHKKMLKVYYRQIKMMLPVKTSYERKFLRDLKQQIKEIICATPHCEYFDIVRQLGMPKDIIAGYYTSISAKQLGKELRSSKMIKIAIVTCVLIVLCLFLYKSWLLEKGHLESTQKYQNRTITEYKIN